MRETIGGYPILGEIGSGGFGTVYRARDPLNDRDVALKVLTDPNDLERFRREARLAYEITTPTSYAYSTTARTATRTSSLWS